MNTRNNPPLDRRRPMKITAIEDATLEWATWICAVAGAAVVTLAIVL